MSGARMTRGDVDVREITRKVVESDVRWKCKRMGGTCVVERNAGVEHFPRRKAERSGGKERRRQAAKGIPKPGLEPGSAG